MQRLNNDTCQMTGLLSQVDDMEHGQTHAMVIIHVQTHAHRQTLNKAREIEGERESHCSYSHTSTWQHALIIAMLWSGGYVHMQSLQTQSSIVT